ncbi:MAG: hypothetical protein K6E78_01080 [Treponema sp.]|nr:hypothetical protein [Treponema sp.]
MKKGLAGGPGRLAAGKDFAFFVGEGWGLLFGIMKKRGEKIFKQWKKKAKDRALAGPGKPVGGGLPA